MLSKNFYMYFYIYLDFWYCFLNYNIKYLLLNQLICFYEITFDENFLYVKIFSRKYNL